MTTYTAFTTLAPQAAAEALGEALEGLDPAPEAVGVIEVEDGSGDWEVGGYFTEPPDIAGLALLALVHGAPRLRGLGTARDRLGRPCPPRTEAGRGGAVLRLRQP